MKITILSHNVTWSYSLDSLLTQAFYNMIQQVILMLPEQLINYLKVVKDTAERFVELMTDHNEA